MARIRTIKPELPQDVKLASVSREARYTFVLLISQADDEGLVPGAHRQLLGLLYPHDEDVTTVMLLRWIEELVTIGTLRWRVTVDGAPVIEITNWSKHQRVDNKGRSSFAGILAPFNPDHGASQRNAVVDSDLPLVAESRGGSPRAAAVRGLEGEGDLGVGPRTVDRGPARAGARTRKPRTVVVSPEAEEVLAYFRVVHPRKHPDDKSAAAVEKALGTYTVVDCKAAIDGNAKDPWAKRTGNQGLTYVFRDNTTTDKYIALGTVEHPPLYDYERMELTDYGERMSRPDKVPA